MADELPDVGNSTTLPQLMAFILSPFMSPSWEVAPKGSQICEIQKNREKICAKKKKITEDSIYVVW